MAYLIYKDTEECNWEDCQEAGTLVLYSQKGTDLGGYCNTHADGARQEQNASEGRDRIRRDFGHE